MESTWYVLSRCPKHLNGREGEFPGQQALRLAINILHQEEIAMWQINGHPLCRTAQTLKDSFTSVQGCMP
jgi:hypothetical protein